MNKKWKPCPFCGPEAENDCSCEIHVSVAKWNSRPIEDALNVRITELEAALREVVTVAETQRRVTKEATEHGAPTISVVWELLWTVTGISLRAQKALEVKP